MTHAADLAQALGRAALAVPGVSTLYPSGAAAHVGQVLATAPMLAPPHPVSVQRTDDGWHATIVLGVEETHSAPQVGRAVAASTQAMLAEAGGGRVTVRIASIA